MFMLIMQFLWKYIDDLIGKGIDILVILELFFYVSATLIPLALPLAMLLSSIMTMGNLAENNELTALKSSGLSLFRILKPLTSVVIIICFCTFLFSNFVIPIATLKWRTLIYDIQETKIATILTPGTYSTVLDGYAIKIKEGNDQEFKEIIIHDHTDPSLVKTVKAERGEVFKSKNGSYLFFKLTNGYVLEELNTNGGMINNMNNGFHPGRKSHFKEASYKVDISGFKINRSDEKLFKNEYEMWNVFQIGAAIDSIKNENNILQGKFIETTKNDHIYFVSEKYKSSTIQNDSIKHKKLWLKLYKLENLSERDLLVSYQSNISKTRRKIQNLEQQLEHIKGRENNMRTIDIEFNKKFSLTFAIFVLFFIGAPLGAIVKKGGFGAPVVIAAILFLCYYILTEIGLNLASTGVLSPTLGVWLATIILIPVAFFLMRSAALDRKIINFTTLIKRNKKSK
jgi:lipopolysaccharide export system permease protein